MNTELKKNKTHSPAPRIDVVMRYFLPVTAGIEINVWNTYKKLVKNGWDVTLHVTRDTYTESNGLKEEEVIDGIKIRRYLFRPFGFRPNIDWESTDGICLHNFDIFPHLWIMLKTLFLKLRGKKTFSLFVTPHGGFCPEWSVFSFVQRSIKHTYTNTIGLFLLNRTADGIRAVSPWEAEEMIHIGVRYGLIQVVTNGLEDEAYMDVENIASHEIKEKVASVGSYIMDNSRIKPIKNIATIIKALALLPPYIHFIHIGTTQDEKYKESLLELTKSLGLEDRVHFLGVIRGIDKYYLYKKALVFVHPALWEANANVVYEAWSQKLPTIVGNNTGMRAQVKQGINGYLVEIDDEKTLSKLILDVIRNKNSDLIKSFNDINLEYVNTHSWSEVGNRMGDFYLSRMDNKFFSRLVKSDLSLEFNQQIDKIIKNKLTCYFISPHLDDAVYSAGSLIEYLSKYTKVSVISVFTEANNHKTLSIRSFLRQCKSKSAIDLFKTRREEDIKICESIEAKAIHLGFFDAPWRVRQVGKLRNIFSFIIPELKSIYPVHRLHISKGRASEHDSVTIENIRTALNKEVDLSRENNFAIFGPAAIGNHVDHVIVRDICKEMFANPIYWVDVPYVNNGQKPVASKMLGELVLWENSSNKIEMLRGYVSQFMAMFSDKKIDLLPELFYFSTTPKVKPKVTIGIPAYNEEGNIKNLIKSLLVQKEVNYRLLEIIIISDGSTDKTTEAISSILDSRIKLVDSKKRKGVMVRQNEILKMFKGDILVLLNADILPKNNYFLNNMVLPFLNNSKIGLVSNKGTPMPAETFLEKIINFSVLIKINIFEQFNSGDNIYMCHGHSRAFSKSFAEKIKWPINSVAEDAYSYLHLKELGFDFYYQPSAEILFRSPQTLFDHIKQSSRFISSKKGLVKLFPKETVNKYFKLPLNLTIKMILITFIKNPFLFMSYMFVYFLAKIDSLIINRAISTWAPSQSSKVLLKKNLCQ